VTASYLCPDRWFGLSFLQLVISPDLLFGLNFFKIENHCGFGKCNVTTLVFNNQATKRQATLLFKKVVFK
jgi:hypothetical protein